MPELYAYIETLVTKSAPWFYLSASPYNLYSFIHDFRDAHYPHGQLILRDASWMTIPGLLSNLTLGTEQYKIDRIKKVHGWLPQRKMILIGDSTQSDPEAYGGRSRSLLRPFYQQLTLSRRKLPGESRLGQADPHPQSEGYRVRRHRGEEPTGEVREGVRGHPKVRQP